MKKTFVSAMFVVVVGFAATGCATGGYLGANPYPGPLGQVVAGNLALTCPGDYFVGPPINRCLGQLGGNVGSYSGYPMYLGGPGGVQLSSTDKTALFCGLGGSGVAMLMNAGLGKVVGAGLVSAASCEVAGAILGRRGGKKSDKNVVQQQPQPQGQSVRWGSDGIPVAVGTRPESPAPSPMFNPSSSQSVRLTCMQQGEVTLENQSSGPLRVFVKGKAEPFVVLLPKEQKCAPTENEYTGQIVGTVVSSDGLTGKVGAAPAKPQSLPGLVLVWR